MSIALNPMKWSRLAHIDDVKPLDEADEAVLQDVREVLQKHGALDRFGIFLAHKHFDLHDGEFILEETDEEKREQRLHVESSDNPDINTIQTMWCFEKEQTTAVTKCVLRCHYDKGHKQRHAIEGS